MIFGQTHDVGRNYVTSDSASVEASVWVPPRKSKSPIPQGPGVFEIVNPPPLRAPGF